MGKVKIGVEKMFCRCWHAACRRRRRPLSSLLRKIARVRTTPTTLRPAPQASDSLLLSLLLISRLRIGLRYSLESSKPYSAETIQSFTGDRSIAPPPRRRRDSLPWAYERRRRQPPTTSASTRNRLRLASMARRQRDRSGLPAPSSCHSRHGIRL